MCRSSNNGWIARSKFRSIFLICVSRIQHILKMHWLNVPFKTPAREDDPRYLGVNFYYDQEDLLRTR
jgi:hypothetical protein